MNLREIAAVGKGLKILINPLLFKMLIHVCFEDGVACSLVWRVSCIVEAITFSTSFCTKKYI